MEDHTNVMTSAVVSYNNSFMLPHRKVPIVKNPPLLNAVIYPERDSDGKNFFSWGQIFHFRSENLPHF